MKKRRDKPIPIKRQVALLRSYLSRRNIPVREGEIEDYVSPDLHYEENKEAVLKVFGVGIGHQYTDAEAIFDQAERVFESRSEKSQLTDYRRCAKNTFTIKELVKKPSNIDKWFEKPNMYDIIGIDAKESCKKRKKKKK